MRKIVDLDREKSFYEELLLNDPWNAGKLFDEKLNENLPPSFDFNFRLDCENLDEFNDDFVHKYFDKKKN